MAGPWAVSQRRISRGGSVASGGGEGGGVEVDAMTGGGGVQEQAGDGAEAVCQFGSLVEGDLRGWRRGSGFDVGILWVWWGRGLGNGVAFAGEDDGKSPGGEQRTKAAGELKGELLLRHSGSDLAAGIVAPMGWVKEDKVGVKCGGGARWGSEACASAACWAVWRGLASGCGL